LDKNLFHRLPEVDEYLRKTEKSKEVFREVSGLIPGGVNSAIQFLSLTPYTVLEVMILGCGIWMETST